MDEIKANDIVATRANPDRKLRVMSVSDGTAAVADHPTDRGCVGFLPLAELVKESKP